MKFLILGLVVLATLVGVVVFAHDDTYYPVPVDDSIVKAGLDAKKAEIILDVIQSYPNITHNPIFRINSVDKEIFQEVVPTVVYYRINLTLAIFKDNPFNPSGFFGQVYTPIVTFNVTIRTKDYKSHQEFRVQSYSGIELPNLSQYDPKKYVDYNESKAEDISFKSEHFWAVYRSLHKEHFAHLREVLAYKGEVIPDPVLEDALPELTGGMVQYKNNHGDLDAPIVRKISAGFNITGRATPGDLTIPRKVIAFSRIEIEERFYPKNSTIAHDLLQVDNCYLDGNNGKCKFSKF